MCLEKKEEEEEEEGELAGLHGQVIFVYFCRGILAVKALSDMTSLLWLAKHLRGGETIDYLWKSSPPSCLHRA